MNTMPNRPQIRNRFTGTSGATPVQDEGAEYLIANARLLAERAVPSFISALRACNVVITEDIPTAAVDQYWRVYWNPHFTKFLAKMAEAVSPTNPCPTCNATSHHKLSYIAGTWIHEAGHRVFKHRERYDTLGYNDHGKWNECADAEMDDDIPGIGASAHREATARGEALPAICLDKWLLLDEAAMAKAENSEQYWAAAIPWDVTNKDPKYTKKPSCWYPDTINQPEGWIAENYYEAYEKPQQQQQQGQGQGQGSKGNAKNPFPKMGNGTPSGGPDHGSGACGEQRPWEDGKPGESSGDGLRPNAPGVTEAEGNAVRRDVAVAIKKQKESGRGTVPGGWEVFADSELQTPKVRWQDRLRAIARQSIAKVRGERLTTYRRLSRSSIVNGCKVIKPSTYEIIPTVMIVLDTSGSMGSGRRSRLERGLSECEAILKLNKVKSYFLDCDANVYGSAQEVKSVRSAKVHGGGGTDMRVGVAAARKQRIKPDIILLLTDGDTPWPDAEDVKGLTMITGIVHEDGINGCPSWMNPIHIDTE